jgi:hypothetical protein
MNLDGLTLALLLRSLLIDFLRLSAASVALPFARRSDTSLLFALLTPWAFSNVSDRDQEDETA